MCCLGVGGCSIQVLLWTCISALVGVAMVPFLFARMYAIDALSTHEASCVV